MPSGWDVYYVVFLSAALALGIPGVLALVSKLLRQKQSDVEEPGSSEALSPREFPRLTAHNETRLGIRVNTRFFVGSNAALVLITTGLILIPCAGLIRPESERSEVILALALILSLAGFATLGLLYAARKGDLNWLNTFQDEDDT